MREYRSAWVLACILAVSFMIPCVTSIDAENREAMEERTEFDDLEMIEREDLNFKDLRDGTEKYTGIVPDDTVSPSIVKNDMGMGQSGLSTQEPSRASDTEKEQGPSDFANGSRISSTGETITGSLAYDPTGTSDLVDWYKISQTDVNPAPNSALGPYNISVELTSFLDGNGGHDDLFEYREVETSPGELELESEYFDYMTLSVLYYDPWMGIMEMGGTRFYYDDLDPSDSWEHSGNWTFGFKTPVPSTGPEDLDGFANGLDEVGWYYIRIAFDYGYRTSPDRDGYGINYQFEVDTSEREFTDEGANTIETASETSTTTFEYSHTLWDQVDWYHYVGTDMEKLWKMNISIERTWGSAAVIPDFEGASTGTIYDSWLHVWIVFPSPGEDEIWGNDDDGWYFGAHVAFTYLITGTGLISDSRYYNVTITDPGVDNPERGAYIGTYVEPITARYDDTSITDYYINFWYTFAKYKINVLNIIEESVNQRPTVSDLRVSSSNEFYDVSGDVTDEFEFTVKYTDPDGDPPKYLDIYFNQGTQDEEVYSIMGRHDGVPYEDGRTYTLVLGGDEIGDMDGPISVMVNASDSIPDTSLRIPLDTERLYLNDTLRIWDDRAVELSSNIDPIDPIEEDSSTILVPMDSYAGGPFYDSEGSLRGVLVFNETEDAYTGDSSTQLLHVNMTYRSGDGWYAQITPKPDMHGEEMVSFFGYDDHSHIIYNYTVTVYPVNDPPVVTGFEFNGDDITIDDRDPSEVVVDLRDENIKEDEEFTFRIIAEDSDPEQDDTPIVFSYLDVSSDIWSADPEIDPDTGVVTFTPQNSDVRTNGLMVFRVMDDTDLVDIRIRLDVANTPDDPTLKLEPKGPSVYQGGTWNLFSLVTDIDPNEDHIFSVNMDENIGMDTDPIRDQLPDAVMGTDYLWTFETDTGKITFEPIFDNIWKNGDLLLEQVTIQIVVKVTDKDLRTDIKMVNLTMIKDGPWIPPVPEISYSIKDEDQDTPGDQGFEVTFNAEEYDSAYGEWNYTWTLAPGVVMTGTEVTYTYDSEGAKNVRFSLVKGEYASQERTLQITLEKYVEPPPEVDDNGSGGISPLVFIGIGAVVVIVLIAVVIFFLRRREPPAEEQHYEEGAGYSRERSSLGSGARQERLTPASSMRGEDLPPAKGPSGSRRLKCPNCGAAVEKEWFLCPECKNTLTW